MNRIRTLNCCNPKNTARKLIGYLARTLCYSVKLGIRSAKRNFNFRPENYHARCEQTHRPGLSYGCAEM
jgi:hypothetical protein